MFYEGIGLLVGGARKRWLGRCSPSVVLVRQRRDARYGGSTGVSAMTVACVEDVTSGGREDRDRDGPYRSSQDSCVVGIASIANP